MLPRVLEPEVMDTAEEAEEYDAMDHAEVNRRFCVELLAYAPEPHRVLDVGTGTARIPIVLCGLARGCSVVATDLADHMLAVARRNVIAAGLETRIELVRADAKASALPECHFDVVMSNSIVHHVPEPARMFEDALRRLAPGGVLFVRDLERPRDRATLERLVANYAANDTPKQRGLFADSLHAALTVDEVLEIVRPLGIAASAVTRTSDRHWTLVHRS